MQNADVLLVLGSSLGTSVTGYDSKQFNPKATKIVVDIDEEELNKNIIHIDYKLNWDLKSFLVDII